MELIEHLEHGLANFVTIAKLVFECVSVFCVIIGLVKTLQLTVFLNRRHRTSEAFPFNQVRIRFGTWLALALEFQLGADILATTVAPTLEALAELGVLALIRTFLNYFLNKELEAELEMEIRDQERERMLTQKYGVGE
ncbi:MAG: DUF1622 domain-containing protein [Leptolyngbyaceae cyanobacterium]